jgi:hypothetical protein
VTGDRTVNAGYGAVVTAVVAFGCYLLALGNGFAFDDVVLIPNDQRVLNGQLTTLLTTPYWNDSALSLYRPLTSLSFGFDWFIGGGSAAWFHFANVLWHVAASLLTYALLLRYFSIGAALLGGVVFATHPVHVEAVANVVGRAEMMAATFVLAACVLWPMLTQRAARASVTAVLYLLALASKESAAVLPALLVMLDCADGEWSFATLPAYLKRRAPELITLVATFAAYMVLRTSIVGGIGPSRLDPSIEVLNSGWHRILTALQAWPLAARVFFFPLTLLADYGPRILLPISSWNSLAVLGATMVIALIAGGFIAIANKKGPWALGLLWFPIAILPVSNFLIPIGVLLAERTLYLPSVAVAFAFAGLFTAARQRVELRRPAIALAVVVCVLFAVRTMIRVPEWKSTDSILLALVRDRPDAFRGQWHRARIARARGDTELALRTYDQALKIWPFREGLVKEAAVFGTSQGRAAWARDVAFYGTQRWPKTVDFHRLVAANALDLGDTATARRTLDRALQLHPNDKILNDMWRAATVTTSK